MCNEHRWTDPLCPASILAAALAGQPGRSQAGQAVALSLGRESFVLPGTSLPPTPPQ